MTHKASQKNPSKEKSEKGITVDQDDFSAWFTQIMLKADLADYTSVSGCIVFKPTAYAIWEKIRDACDQRFKPLGVQNTYFPLFIPEKLLKREQDHVAGFSPEVAWVTHAGETKLTERLAVRPTSEAIMYESYSKWIRSWRDLPLKYNQWNNAVRWEFKHPVPFLRTREFLWNEGHTVFASEEEAIAEGPAILEAYRDVCENYLALYGVAGRKTEQEKFAGGVYSEKLHYILPTGKAIEGPAFHHDGQNFAKAYDITFLDKEGKKQYGWQNTWAISTRMLGVLFAIHSDEKGLILPPRIAPLQAVIVPVYSDANKATVLREAMKLQELLKDVSVKIDDRDEYRPGYKFNEWELKGIPLRIEIGERDIAQKSVVVVRRDTGEKISLKISALVKEVPKILDAIHDTLFERSKKLFTSRVGKAETLPALQKLLDDKMISIVPLCNSAAVEETLKEKTGAKTLFIASEKISKQKCIVSGKNADYWVYVGKSY